MGDFAGLRRGLLKEENRANETSGTTETTSVEVVFLFYGGSSNWVARVGMGILKCFIDKKPFDSIERF